jgi:hypothetical protein
MNLPPVAAAVWRELKGVEGEFVASVPEKEKKRFLASELESRSPFDAMLYKYYDHDSYELLDEKIRVFSERIAGKSIGEIPGYEDVYELLPKNDGIPDENGLVHRVRWD